MTRSRTSTKVPNILLVSEKYSEANNIRESHVRGSKTASTRLNTTSACSAVVSGVVQDRRVSFRCVRAPQTGLESETPICWLAVIATLRPARSQNHRFRLQIDRPPRAGRSDPAHHSGQYPLLARVARWPPRHGRAKAAHKGGCRVK